MDSDCERVSGRWGLQPHPTGTQNATCHPLPAVIRYHTTGGPPRIRPGLHPPRLRPALAWASALRGASSGACFSGVFPPPLATDAPSRVFFFCFLVLEAASRHVGRPKQTDGMRPCGGRTRGFRKQPGRTLAAGCAGSTWAWGCRCLPSRMSWSLGKEGKNEAHEEPPTAQSPATRSPPAHRSPPCAAAGPRRAAVRRRMRSQ